MYAIYRAALFLLVAGCLFASPGSAQVSQVPEAIAGADSLAAIRDTTVVGGGDPDFILTDDLFDSLENEGCPTVDGYAYRALPYWIVNDDANSVFDFLYFWEVQCGATEPLQRMWILATIWQGSFDESYYDEDITEYMIERWKDEDDAQPALRRSFDEFTVDMADQMLPHQSREGLEEFWCLFYSGRRDEAWAKLDDTGPKDSWLYHYRDNETARLLKQKNYSLLTLTAGGWWPDGDLEWVGDKTLFGGLYGQRGRDWLARVVFEVRSGRTAEPYMVPEASHLGRSNRFNATYMGGELGRIIPLSRRQAFDLFFGIGIDVVVPFQDEDVALLGWDANLGAGYRCFLGSYREFVLGVDVRREWVVGRNEDPYKMDGSAWSVRAAVGYAFVSKRNRTLDGLGK